MRQGKAIEHCGVTDNGAAVHRVYFNQYGVPVAECDSTKVIDHACRLEHEPVLAQPRCQRCRWGKP